MQENIEMPQGIQAQFDKFTLKLKGQKGESSRIFKSPAIQTKIEGTKISFIAKNATKREKTMIGTFTAHVKNMIKGITEGHVYKMKICSGHFPMKVTLKGKNFVV